MKLYLSSYRVPVPRKLFDLVGKGSDISVAVIPNAQDAYIERIWNMKTQEAVSYFRELGIAKCDVVDLKKYTNPDELKKELSQYDLVWANGGNSFMLRYEMKRSGFDTIIRDLLESGVVYGGESAGQLVAGPTLHGVESADKPEFAQEIVWGGLGLVDKMIFPHADNSVYAQVLTVMRNLYPGLIELKNSQAYVVDGDREEIVERAL